jgi:hypothetical protein
MKKIGRFACLLVLAGLVLAVTPLFAKGNAQSGGKKLTIGFAVAAINTNSIWIDIRRAYEEKCKREGWTLITGDLTEGAPKAIAFLETCITAKADVVILQNIADGASPESYKQGDLEYFRVKAANPAAEVSFTALFSCPDFYGAKPKALETGAPAVPVNCKFTNPFSTTIGNYNIKVLVPKGKEIIMVSAPKAYADFVLGKEEGMRSVSVGKKKLAPLAAVTLTFSFGRTLANSVPKTIILWVLCLGIGGAVIIVRRPRKKTEEG